MKQHIRQISALLLLVILLAAFTSRDSKVTPELPAEGAGKEDKIDMYGYVFDILSYNRGNVLQFLPKAGDTAMGDAQLAHYKKVEKDINISIKVEDASGDQVSKITNAAAIGEKGYDMADMFLSDGLGLYKSGYLNTLNEVLDEEELFSGKYGTKNQLEATSHRRANGTDYWGFKCAYWGIPYPSFQGATYYNNVLLQEFGQPNPYELYEKKNWTWNTFSQICNALVTPGEDPTDPADDTFGLPNDKDQRYVPRAAMTSNGVKFVYFNESTGLYETDIDSPKCLAALDFCQSLTESGAMKQMSGKTADTLVGNAVNAFMTGRTGFLVEYTYHGLVDKGSLSYYKDFVFEWITFPWGPDGTYGQVNSTISANDHYVFLPVNADVYDLSIILPVLLEPFEGYGQEDWRESLTQRCFFSQESADIFFEMYDNAVYDFYDAQGDLHGGDITNIILSGKKTAAEVIESSIEKIKEAVDTNRNDLLLTSGTN